MKHLAAVALVLILLSGCASQPADQPTDSPTAPVAVVGESIEADAVAGLTPPLYPYPLPDGTMVVVSADEPLPEAVQSDLNRQATEFADELTPQSYIDTGQSQIEAIISDAANHTGKRPVMIARITGIRTASGSETIQTWYWAWGAGDINGESGFDTLPQSIAAATDWIAQRERPEQWILLVPAA